MNILDSNTINSFTGEFGNHFDTFSAFRDPVIVFKEPLKAYTNVSQPNFGYGAAAPEVTYTPVSGTFPAIIIYPKDQDRRFFGESRSWVPQGDVGIKVQTDARDYIENGKTEYFIVEDIKYNQLGNYRQQNYFGLRYYYYDLKRTE